jgi:hypothetical protein
MFKSRFSRRSFRRSARSAFGGARFVSDSISGVALGMAYRDNVRYLVIGPSNVAGIRRSRGLDVYIAPGGGIVQWALIYVPQGIDWHAVGLHDTTADIPASLYQPEQHVIASGIAAHEETVHAYGRGSRALADGDSVILILRSAMNSDPAPTCGFRVSYQIAFS